MLSESPDPTRIDQYAPCPEEPRRQAQALAPPAAGLCTGPVAGGLSVGTLSARTSGRRPGFRVCYLPTVRWLEPYSYPECSAAGELGLFLQPERLHSSSGPRNDVQLSAVDVLRIRPPGMARVHVGVRRCGGSTTARAVRGRLGRAPQLPQEPRENSERIQKIWRQAWQILSEQGLGHGACLSWAATLRGGRPALAMMFAMPVRRRE